MYSFADRVLGKSGEQIPMASSGEGGELALAMVRQCKRRLDIASRHLDPALYDNARFAEAVKALALRSRHARIRLLVFDPEPLIRRGHRLVETAGRLSSFIEIRKPGPEQPDCNEAMLIADETGFIHRQLSDRYEGIANFNDRALGAELARRFGELWQHAIPEPNFRRLFI